MQETLTLSAFSDCLGSIFRLPLNDTKVFDLELFEAVGLKHGAPPSVTPRERGSFSLLFRGPMSPSLPQKIYVLDHETLGKVELFLVPIGPDQAGMRYEAVFN